MPPPIRPPPMLLVHGVAALFALLATGLIFAVLPVPAGYDELQHLSYAAAMQDAPSLLPDFAAMRELDPADLSRWTDRPNYHSHPSFFYLLTAPLLDRAAPVGDAVRRLRLGALLISVLAIWLALAAGRRALREPRAVLAFCVVVGVCPLMVMIAAHYSNDSLAVLGGALAYLGSTCRGASRSAALAGGVVLACWAKLNAGLLVGLWAGLFALLAREPRLVLAVALAGLVGALPHLGSLWQHGALTPVTLEAIHGAVPLGETPGERLLGFLARVPATWGAAPKPGAVRAVGVLLLLGAVAWGVAAEWRGGPGVALAALGAAGGVLVLHAAYVTTTLGGSLSGASLRYYLPLLPMIAHAAVLPALRHPAAIWLPLGATLASAVS